MSNTIIVLGNISRDPEIKQVGGDAVLKIGLADNVGWGDRQTTNWHNVDYWGAKRAQALMGILQKGSMIEVTGEQTIRSWTNEQGIEKFSNDIRADRIVVLPKANQPSGANSPQPVADTVGGVSDDMPF
jgi:single-strand DNA-binding protein